MKTYFRIIEHIPHGRMEFTFHGFKDLTRQLKMYVELFKLRRDKKYRVLIEEI